MSAPVDVLAVMERVGDASASRRLNYEERDELWVARAAVAELIEENKQLRVKANNWDCLMHARATSATDPDDCEWKQLARRGSLIEAIKACRSAHGYSLRESKDCVEGYIARVRGAA